MKRQLFPRDTADTADVLDVLIYSSKPGESSWKAEWQGWAERKIWRDVDVSLGVHAGITLFSVLSCVNGTGGCQQHFLGRVSRNWVAVDEAYYTQLARRFGADAFWKGVNVDARTLRGTIPLYSSGDANCCASREIYLTLAVRGTRIVMARAALTRLNTGNRMPPAEPSSRMAGHARRAAIANARK